MKSATPPAAYRPINTPRTGSASVSAAPAVYRPIPMVARRIAPLSAAAQAKPTAGRIAGPEVYRPAVLAQPGNQTAPPVYRPDVPHPGGPSASLQTKRAGVAPRVYNPNAIQMVKVKKPTGVELGGGAGVSVIWKKSKKSDNPHVSVVHKALDKAGDIDVTNFHYKFSHAGYYNWNDKNDGSKIFSFAGGDPSLSVYQQTQKMASKFGITLEKPASVLGAEAVEAAHKAAEALAASSRAAAEKIAAKRSAAYAAEEEAREEAFARKLPSSPVATPVHPDSASSGGSWDDF